jgi:hypothetical protein
MPPTLEKHIYTLLPSKEVTLQQGNRGAPVGHRSCQRFRGSFLAVALAALSTPGKGRDA